MGEFVGEPERTRRDPGTTSVDRAGVPAPRGGGLVRLPGALAGRFTVLGELAAQGAESDLVHVTGQDGRDLVVKIFRRGYRADPEVWRKLPELRSEHIVRTLETGHAEERDYEVIEYLPAGNLRALMARAMPTDLVKTVVAQLAEGLTRLHAVDIVHRDLKPENVLIAATAPLRLVIADFGLSRVIDQSVVFASSSRTLAYAAPESLSGQVSTARDWWSLGMIARELLTGRPPFQGMSETVVVDHLATRPIDNDDIEDARLRLLCEGLLTRDPRRRWGAAEVAGWRQGQSPRVYADSPVPAQDRAVATGPGLLFNGRRYTGRGELAKALVTQWDAAARFFFARGPRSEAWRTLREWLEGLRDDGFIELVDSHLTSEDEPPDVKLLHLVRWLDPDAPANYLGRRISREDLPGLAGLAGDPSHPDHDLGCRMGRDLWRYGLLPELSGDLAALDHGWRSRASAWNTLVEGLRPHLPARVAARLPEAGGAQDEPPAVLLSLLAVAVDPAYAVPALAQAVRAAREQVRAPAEWFTWLVDGAGEDPLRLLAVVQTLPEALAESERAVRERALAERNAETQRARWAEQEAARQAGAASATTKAMFWSIPILVLWLVGSLLVNALFGGHPKTVAAGTSQGAQPVPGFLLVIFALLGWGIEVAAEVLVARRQGGEYLPYGPWAWLSKALGASGRGLSRASSALSGATRQQGLRGCGCMLLACVVPLFLVLLALSLSVLAEELWIVVVLGVAVVHAAAAGLRLHRWRQARESAQREVSG